MYEFIVLSVMWGLYKCSYKYRRCQPVNGHFALPCRLPRFPVPVWKSYRSVSQCSFSSSFLFWCRILLAHGVLLSGVSIIRLCGERGSYFSARVVCKGKENRSYVLCVQGGITSCLWLQKESVITSCDAAIIFHSQALFKAALPVGQVSQKHTQLAYRGGKGCTLTGTNWWI